MKKYKVKNMDLSLIHQDSIIYIDKEFADFLYFNEYTYGESGFYDNCICVRYSNQYLINFLIHHSISFYTIHSENDFHYKIEFNSVNNYVMTKVESTAFYDNLYFNEFTLNQAKVLKIIMVT